MSRSGRRPLYLPACVLLAICACAAFAAATPVPPTDFVIENAVTSGTFTQPTSVAVAPGGRWYVAERAGRVYAVESGVKKTTPFLDLRQEILSDSWHGLLGILVDPNFATNRYVYLLYTVDPDSDGVEQAEPNAYCFGRITRYQAKAADLNAADPASRTVLLGGGWPNAPLVGFYHTIEDFTWGRDGSLLVGIGDGATSDFDIGGLYPNVFLPGRANPAEDIGVFRAQYLESLDGKILRIDPATGNGYPSNPFWDGNATSVRSRVWAYGLKTPYRLAVRPLTGVTDPAAGNPGALVIGEVGLDTWEELDVATAGGRNFGWPCYEGPATNDWYIGAAPAHHGCATIGTPDNPSPATAPVYTYHHSDPALSVPPGFHGFCIVGGAFYTGTSYPSPYRGAYFYADWGRSVIRRATFDASQQIIVNVDFATAADGPVHFTVDPATGDVLYVSYMTSQIRRIRYTGSVDVDLAAPVAIALSEAFPNPTKSIASLTLEVPVRGDVRWTVSDLQGHVVWREWRSLDAGRWTLQWPGTDERGRRQRPGVYFARIEHGGQSLVRRIVLRR